MSPSSSPSFLRAVALYRNADYPNALLAFNQAIQESPSEKAFYDSRAAVHEKLNQNTDALKDAKKVIDLAPQSWQGYARSARLFVKIGKLGSADKMLDLALERLPKGSDPKRRAELQELKSQIANRSKEQPRGADRDALARARGRVPYITNLPFEVLSWIFELATDNRASLAARLSHVCTQWHRVALNSPNLWRSLVLSSKSRIKDVDAQLDRAKGIVYSLHIAPTFRHDNSSPNILRSAGAEFWNRLQSLTINLSDNWTSVPAILAQQIAPQQLSLRSFEMTFTTSYGNPSESNLLKEILNLIKIDQLTDLKIKQNMLREGEILDFKSLRTLSLGHKSLFHMAKIHNLLQSNPDLEKLSFDFGFIDGPSFDIQTLECLSFAHLSHLEIGPSITSVKSFLSLLDLPRLTNFTLNGKPNAESVFNEILDVVSPQQLTELRVFGCNPTESSMVQYLEKAPKLEVLHITDYPNPMDTLCDRLAGWDHASKSVIPQLCPALTDINFSRSSRLMGSGLVRIVKSHLAPTVPPATTKSNVPNSSSGPDGSSTEVSKLPSGMEKSPIRSLVIDECPLVDPDALPWLRANVKYVSCVYMTSKQAKKAKLRYL